MIGPTTGGIPVRIKSFAARGRLGRAGPGRAGLGRGDRDRSYVPPGGLAVLARIFNRYCMDGPEGTFRAIDGVLGDICSGLHVTGGTSVTGESGGAVRLPPCPRVRGAGLCASCFGRGYAAGQPDVPPNHRHGHSGGTQLRADRRPLRMLLVVDPSVVGTGEDMSFRFVTGASRGRYAEFTREALDRGNSVVATAREASAVRDGLAHFDDRRPGDPVMSSRPSSMSPRPPSPRCACSWVWTPSSASRRDWIRCGVNSTSGAP